MIQGIYTLANDVVYDQLVALLNSIEVNAGIELPIYVIAYNENIERVKAEIKIRDNVEVLDDPALFKIWEDFSYDIWQTHPTALNVWKESGVKTRFYRVGENHRYIAFDEAAPLDEFLYLDADTLVMGSLQPVFEALANHDCVIYDFQFKDPTHIFNVESTIAQTLYAQPVADHKIFCSGFFSSKKGIFPPEKREWYLQQLAQGDAEVFYLGAPNQSVLNYLVHKGRFSVCNLVDYLPKDAVTGNSVTSSHFQSDGNGLLYDKGARLTYLHYIGVSSKCFKRLCDGENIGFPYRDVFLHYRYLKTPDQRPHYRGKPYPCQRPPSRWQRLLKKLGVQR